MAAHGAVAEVGLLGQSYMGARKSLRCRCFDGNCMDWLA